MKLVASCPTVGCTHIDTAIRVDHRGRCTGCIRYAVQIVVSGGGPVVIAIGWRFPRYSTVVGQGNTVRVLAGLCIHPSTCEGQDT